MKIVFLQTTGKSYPWEIKSVKPGFFRNFLLPKKLAVPASEKIITETESMRKEQERLRLERVEKAKAEKTLIEWKILEFKVKTDWGHMYASISEKDVADRILSEFNITLDSKAIKHIKLKDVWESDVNVNLWDWVSAIVKVKILSDSQPKDTKKWTKKASAKKKNDEVENAETEVNDAETETKEVISKEEKKTKKTKKAE